MWTIIGVGSVGAIVLIVVMTLWFSRKTQSQEMMSYLPDDCDEVIGLNLGHAQKYPEFYKSCENSINTKGFKAAADIFSKALGSDTTTVVEYVIQGTGKTGGQDVEATIFRTKEEFDQSLLKNIEGAQEGTANGVKYYAIPEIAALKYPQPRVFAPTNRIVVFCRGDIPDAKFRAMLTGNKDTEETSYTRAGPLIKAVTRGTAWRFVIYGRTYSPPEPPPKKSAGQGENDEDNLKTEIAEILKPAKGMGYKASIGSREVRGEWVVWLKDSEAASSLVKRWREKEWIKDDEKGPPRWWKTVASRSGGGKTAENALKDGLSFSYSGDTFTVRTSLETKVLMPGTLIQAFTGQGGGAMMPSGGPGLGGAGGPVPGKGPGGPGGGPAPGGIAPGGPGGGAPGGIAPGGPGGGAPGGAPTVPPGGGPGGPPPGGPGPQPGKMPRRRAWRRQISSRI